MFKKSHYIDLDNLKKRIFKDFKLLYKYGKILLLRGPTLPITGLPEPRPFIHGPLAVAQGLPLLSLPQYTLNVLTSIL